MIVIDTIICLFVCFLGFNLKNIFKSLDTYERNLLNKLFFFHLFTGIVFYFYILTRGDAVYYWMYPKNESFTIIWNNLFEQGYASDYVYFLNFLFSNTFDLSFFTGSIIYCILGYASFIYFLLVLKKVLPRYRYLREVKVFNIPIFPTVLFMPNLHFWSCGVGKDTLLFFAIMLFVYALLDIKKHAFGLIISLLISYLIRPHITLFLIVAFGLGYASDSKMKTYQKILVFLVFGVGFIVVFNSVLSFVKIDEFNSESFNQFSESKVTALSNAESGIDISSYPYPVKILTFLYRPLFFDVHNPISLIASFENLFLLLISSKFLRNRPLRTIHKSNWLIKSSFYFFLLGAFAFSLILSNLGIMLREKNMFTLTLYLFIFWSFYHIYIQPVLNKSTNGNKNIN